MFKQGYASGITRVFDELLVRMPANGIDAVLLVYDRGKHFARFPQRRLQVLPWYRLRPRGFFDPFERTLRRHQLARCRGMVFHSTFFTDSSPVDLPEVVSVHDMIPELFPEFFRDRWSVRHVADKARCISRARLVVCGTETTRRDLCRIAGVPEEKIRMVPYAIGDKFRKGLDAPGTEPSTALPDSGYFLYVGSRAPYKGFWNLVRALVQLPPNLRCPLLCVGGGITLPFESQGLRTLGATDLVRFLGRVTDEELITLYRRATAVCVPSYYEGFGLVAPEALAVGATVICGDTPALREAAGDCADYYVDPASVSALADCLSDARRRAPRPKKAGRPASLEHTWDESAKMLADVYRELLERRTSS
jgi:glycosyltransferase involved in cell wall biosynthesis